jgi:hypothetical protein
MTRLQRTSSLAESVPKGASAHEQRALVSPLEVDQLLQAHPVGEIDKGGGGRLALEHLQPALEQLCAGREEDRPAAQAPDRLDLADDARVQRWPFEVDGLPDVGIEVVRECGREDHLVR